MGSNRFVKCQRCPLQLLEAICYGFVFVLSWKCRSIFALVLQANTQVESIWGLPNELGVTSLLVLSTKHPEDKENLPRIYVGTKHGRAFASTGSLKDPSWTELTGGSSNLPIFSLAAASQVNSGSSRNNHLLFCGEGDRFVTVWEEALGRQKASPSQNNEPFSWSIVQRLGPHTGWVKSLLYDEANNLLHSIGCNYIETWGFDRQGDPCDESLPPLKHLWKRSISNSPTMGSTLSSDLLSLCLLGGDQSLVSGGVDGRLHLWSANYTLAEPLTSIRAHDGRVTVLKYANKSGILFSAGYDGRLCAFRRLENDSSECMLRRSPTVHSLIHETGKPFRFTAATCFHDSLDSVGFVLGTSCGRISFIRATTSLQRNENDKSLINLEDLGSLQLRDSVMIYAVVALSTHDRQNQKTCILVGHANGLSKITLPKVEY